MQVKGARFGARARTAKGEERDRLWSQALQMWPAYDTYVQRSGRNLKVFSLDPA